jgi:hypothetical protein
MWALASVLHVATSLMSPSIDAMDFKRSDWCTMVTLGLVATISGFVDNSSSPGTPS